MAGNCIIEVTSDYLASLDGVIQVCHQEMAESYRVELITGFECCNTCDTSLDNLLLLSDILFYLLYFNIDEDDCSFVHSVKEKAMKICTFNETDITDNLFLNAILTEGGLPIITENSTNYLQLEDS